MLILICRKHKIKRIIHKTKRLCAERFDHFLFDRGAYGILPHLNIISDIHVLIKYLQTILKKFTTNFNINFQMF